MYSKPYDLPPEALRFLKKDVKRHNARYKGEPATLRTVELSFFTKGVLNTYFRARGLVLTVEYAMIFTWKAGEVQPLHIDGTPPDHQRHASLNLLMKGGEDAVFEWYDAEVLTEPRVSSTGIQSFQIKDNTATLVHREPLQKCSVVRTSIPHRVTNFTTDTHLLCLRMQGNPTINMF